MDLGKPLINMIRIGSADKLYYMRVSLRFVSAVAVLALLRINVATVSNKVKRMENTVMTPKPRKLVKKLSQIPTMCYGCWLQGNDLLLLMDEDPRKSRVYWV